MTASFWDFNIGNLITILALVFAVWKFNQKRHEQNLHAMAQLAAKVSHFDACIDELKQEVSELRKQLIEYMSIRRR